MTGVDEIDAERTRQVGKGYTRQHDRHHSARDLAAAAGFYLLADGDLDRLPRGWSAPLLPEDERERLVKAGALIAAAIDRLDEEVLRDH